MRFSTLQKMKDDTENPPMLIEKLRLCMDQKKFSERSQPWTYLCCCVSGTVFTKALQSMFANNRTEGELEGDSAVTSVPHSGVRQFQMTKPFIALTNFPPLIAIESIVANLNANSSRLMTPQIVLL